MSSAIVGGERGARRRVRVAVAGDQRETLLRGPISEPSQCTGAELAIAKLSRREVLVCEQVKLAAEENDLSALVSDTGQKYRCVFVEIGSEEMRVECGVVAPGNTQPSHSERSRSRT